MQFFIGAVLCAATLIGSAGAWPAGAQEYWRRLDTAQNQLNQLDREERFDLAARRCHETIEQKQSAWIVVWCDLAASAAVRQRDRARRSDYSDDERALLWDAAWLQALEGIQSDGFFAAPLIERVSIADDASNRRLGAYRLLSNLRSRDYRNIEHYVQQLGEIDGITIGPSTSLLVGRRQLIDALLTQPRTSERLWAVAAAALTFELEYRSSEVSRDGVIADAREVAELLGGLVAETDGLTGQDAALFPLLLFAQAKALSIARDYSGAQRSGQAGYEACVTRLRPSASICLDLGMEAASAKLLGDLTAADPNILERPAEPPLSARQRGVEYTEARCRVILVGDIDDTGGFANVRSVYQNPDDVCRAMALRYVSERNYRAIEQAIPGTRRQNVIVRFVLTSP